MFVFDNLHLISYSRTI